MVSEVAAVSAADPKRYVNHVVRASGTSFYWPMMVLPRAKREAMLALYAFCRETDDVVDEIEDAEEALRRLDAWRAEIDALYRGRPSHPVALALAGPVSVFGLPRQRFLDILDGFEMDRSGAMYRPSLATLELYCHRVASCVGLLSVEIFGYRDRRIPEFAEHLGHAFQLTNILRDVAEDARRGRIYLPREVLARHGMAEVEADTLFEAPGLKAVCAEIGGMARRRFAAASSALPASEERAMRPALLMRAVYEAYLDRLAAGGWEVGGRRLRLRRLAKARLLLGALIRT